jgi:hypothetical protein
MMSCTLDMLLVKNIVARTKLKNLLYNIFHLKGVSISLLLEHVQA